MTTERNIDLINDLLAMPSETTWIEFKNNNANPETIGKYCSALSNAARVADKACAYMLWGIENATHNIVGTKFNPDTAKKGNQGLPIWLAKHLKPDLAFSFEIVEHPQGRIVLLNLPAARHAPVEFDGTAYIRIGEATPKLSDHPNRFQRLIEALRPYAWEQGTAKSYVEADKVLRLLDYEQYFRLMKQVQPDDPAGIWSTQFCADEPG